jgi:hypothetical protein
MIGPHIPRRISISFARRICRIKSRTSVALRGEQVRRRGLHRHSRQADIARTAGGVRGHAARRVAVCPSRRSRPSSGQRGRGRALGPERRPCSSGSTTAITAGPDGETRSNTSSPPCVDDAVFPVRDAEQWAGHAPCRAPSVARTNRRKRLCRTASTRTRGSSAFAENSDPPTGRSVRKPSTSRYSTYRNLKEDAP